MKKGGDQGKVAALFFADFRVLPARHAAQDAAGGWGWFGGFFDLLKFDDHGFGEA